MNFCVIKLANLNILRLLLRLGAVFSFLFLANLAAADASADDRYASLAVQGRLTAAGEYLLTVHGVAAADRLRRRFERRFILAQEKPPSSGDGFVDELILAYQRYWRSSLLDAGVEPRASADLEDQWRAALGRHEAGWPPPGGAGLRQRLERELTRRGYRFSFSAGPPVRDLMLWRSERSGDYVVKLVGQTFKTRVSFASSFVLKGWKDYAALGLAGTTGWVETERLVCVAEAWNTNSERFDVSFLRHEGRHLADTRLYPGLEAVELEYRAKLTELSFARTTLPRLLDDFLNGGALNPDSPHATANLRVMQDLATILDPASGNPERTDWQAIPARTVNRAARELLERNNEALDRQAAEPRPSP